MISLGKVRALILADPLLYGFTAPLMMSGTPIATFHIVRKKHRQSDRAHEPECTEGTIMEPKGLSPSEHTPAV